MRVEIENAYSCGQSSASTEDVPTPVELDEDWWEDVVYPLTGDGHRCGSSDDAYYTATIVGGPHDGIRHEWG